MAEEETYRAEDTVNAAALPPSVRRMANVADVWVLGSTALHGVRPGQDVDVMVPLPQWYIVASFIPTDAVPTTLGGWRFTDGEYAVDVWPDDLGRLAVSPVFKAAWNPRSGVVLVPR